MKTHLPTLLLAVTLCLAGMFVSPADCAEQQKLEQLEQTILSMQSRLEDLTSEVQELREFKQRMESVPSAQLLRKSRSILQGATPLQSGNSFPSGLNVDSALTIEGGDIEFQSTGGGHINGVSHLRLSNQEDSVNYIDGPEGGSLLIRLTDSNDANDVFGIEVDKDVAASQSNIQRVLTIKPSGNVGIGTSNPAGALHVSQGWDAVTSIGVGEVDTASKELRFFYQKGANETGAHRVVATPTLLSFTKDTYVPGNSSTWTRLDFATCGAVSADNPFWNGCHFAGFTVTDSLAVQKYPRASMYYSATTAANPTDLRFNIQTGNSGDIPVDFRLSTSRSLSLFGSKVGVNLDPNSLSGSSLAGSAAMAVAGGIHSQGKLSAEESLLSRGGAVQRDIFDVSYISSTTSSSTNRYIHFKTNIPDKSSIMFRIVMEGYRYWSSAPIFSECVGYTYGNGFTHDNCVDHHSSSTSAQYISNDGFVIVVLEGESYHVGVSVSAWTVNPSGNSFRIEISQSILSSSAVLTW